ncbi:hypothetical protein SAMN05216188_122152 [Lentzea xinjiangensis]|uniref:Uncharacterized protein n=1 Tax=Lentzea xinjiangensis TaxID=402600 RepID=A0A1H9UU88_9PSEU|nr:hypothetical protein [Lentzea xinjiangensis]SES12982.1 hypothetical protein SAMN05216188_122152 [Lentzea xinjiangensis]
MPERTTLSIKVVVAPHVAEGLHALVRKALAGPTATRDERGRRGGDTYVNKVSGTVNDTVIQIGRLHGNFNDHRGR